MTLRPSDVGSARLAVAAISLVALLTACQDALEPSVATTLEIVDGARQVGAAGMPGLLLPTVRVLDQHGRTLPGVVVRFTVTAGSGHVEVERTVTDGRGLASSGVWTLGPIAGVNALSASVSEVEPVGFEAEGVAGEPEAMAVVSGEDQSGVVGTSLPLPVEIRVMDAFGNPVAGADVVFGVEAGGGAFESGTVLTDAGGVATGRWRLGTVAGVQRAFAEAGGQRADLVATGLPAEASRVEIAAGNGQSAEVATAVPVAPAVRVTDAFGNAVGGVEIVFEVVAGAGVVDGSQSSGAFTSVGTDSAGMARLGRWVLGTRSGTNTLHAKAGSLSVVLTATGLPSAPSSVEKAAGDGQSAPAGEPLAVAPSIRVLDRYGNPVERVSVSFTTTSGILASTAALTGGDGRASVGTWTLGPGIGVQTLNADAGPAGSVSFTATATSGSTGGSGGSGSGSGGTGPYDLVLRISGSATSAQQSEFYAAAGRWGLVITGDLPDVPVNIPANACGVPHAAINETVDDLIILISVGPIDGPGKILGSAGPCFIRSAGGLPVVGAMRLDEADVAFLEGAGRLGDVVAHEIGHIIGVGTRWGSFLTGAGTTDPYFTGASALTEFGGAGGSAYPGTPVPVENLGGPGTRDGHWRESIFRNELMTGWIDMGANPLSTVTVGSLRDIGYAVDMNHAEGFSITVSAAQDSSTSLRPPPIVIGERPLGIVPVAVDARGRRVPLSELRR